ncbi:DUF4160 domain-containing protein [Daejeonella sp.]|uniref:DUF4160 domain-containing protein n=1 Tax=Daejeonella sp. TaxID=2805397 RepID=UPI0030BF54D8
MPTVFEFKGYRFYFYSNENDEPIHIHVAKANSTAKFWVVTDVREEYSYGFKVKERKEIGLIIKSRQEEIKNAWNEYFK